MSELVENFDDGNHIIVDNENLLEDNNREVENNSVVNDDANDNDSSHEGGSKLSDSDESASENESDSDVEYEEIDLTDNPLYQVLSTLFEDEEGNNLCTILKSLVQSVDANTNALNRLLKKKSKN